MRWSLLLLLLGCGRANFDPIAVDAGSDAGDVFVGDGQRRLALGFNFTCLLDDGGAVTCWGSGARGRLGNGAVANIGDDEPASAGGVGLGGTATQITAGADHACARLDTGNVRCWGINDVGELGYPGAGDVGDDELPATVGDVMIGVGVVEVVAGGLHSCVRLAGGSVRCWGSGSAGRLGYGNTTTIGDDETPATAADIMLGGAATQVRTRGSHVCALLDTDNVRCWGNGANGQLGHASTQNIGDDDVPAVFGDVPVGMPVVEIAIGSAHTCALLATGAVRCWGEAANGRLGYGDTVRIGDDEPAGAGGDIELGGRAVQITAGGSHTCARLTTGAVRCWGLGALGRLGYASTQDIGDDETPDNAGDVDLGGRAHEIVAGGVHTCARLESGAVRCWGDGATGALGYGNTATIGDDESPATAGDVPLD